MWGKSEPEALLRIEAVDLHIHTCLSPCASLDMTPIKIVEKAEEKGLSLIAVTDHNSAENVAAVVEAGKRRGLAVLPGIEVTTVEEAHLIALFEDVEKAISMQMMIYERLQAGENDEDLFGIQAVSNHLDELEGINKRLLIGTAHLTLEETVSAIHKREGLAIAAHLDSPSFSIHGQLGFIPEGLGIDAVEISGRLSFEQARKRFRGYDRLPFITSSDAHMLEQIGTSPMYFLVAGADMGELKMALMGVGERKPVGSPGRNAVN